MALAVAAGVFFAIGMQAVRRGDAPAEAADGPGCQPPDPDPCRRTTVTNRDPPAG